jgi:hypothetical protein
MPRRFTQIWYLSLAGLLIPAVCEAQGGSSNPDILDSIIAVAIILFIVSVITEKITQLIRKYSPFIRPGTWLYYTSLRRIWRNIGDKQYSSKTKKDKRIEREVNTLSFIIGLIITCSFSVDLFRMLSEAEPRNILFWNHEHWFTNYWSTYAFGKALLMVASFALTAFFLTFGSKFFHDLLDTLFQVKTLKRKLADPRTFEDPQTIEELKEFIQLPEAHLSRIAVQQNTDEIKKIPGVIAVGPGYMKIDGQKTGCLEIHALSTADLTRIKKIYPVELSSGLVVNIQSKVIILSDIPRAAAINAGGQVANTTEILGWGTIGGVVKDSITQEKYILSCFHVLNGSLDWTMLSASKQVVIKDGNSKTSIATLSLGFRSMEFDTALAKLNDGVDFSNRSIGNPKTIRKIVVADAINETGVTVLGGETQKKVKGFVYNDTWESQFRYQDDSKWKLIDLFIITRIEGSSFKALSQPGDSGAFVVDDSNNVVGMVVGGDDKFTYAIKMDKIAENFGIELI